MFYGGRVKKLDLALAVIEGKIKLADALMQVDHSEQDAFERYCNLCDINGHDPASSEIGAFDGKE